MAASEDGEANNNDISGSIRKFTGTPVQTFYAEQTIFITGGTGFLGKTLTEKLLRSCPDISRIYLLVRSKKGKTAQNRLQDLFEERIYDRIKKEVPKFRDKIVAVNGDCCVDGLAISEKDRQVLSREVSIVFHLAATVRFNENLKWATAINVRGTSGVLELCKRMRNLKSFIHVSTAYANCHLDKIEERFYDYTINHQQLLALTDVLPEPELDNATFEFLQRWPNTYTFTKAIAEGLIKERNESLPIGIFRPAIVVSVAHEPLPGWIDNLYGPTGVVAGGASGILKVLRCDPDILANVVPVDVTVNALIATAWDVFTQTNRRDETMLIYNFVASVDAPITWREFTRINKTYVKRYPLKSCVWYHSFRLVKSRTFYLISIFFLHLLPALLVDAVSVCLGRKPRSYKTYGKIHRFSDVVTYFCLNEISFTNDNVRALCHRLDAKDRLLFNFDMRHFDWQAYLHNYVLGIRTYLFNENPDNLSDSIIRANRLYWLHQAVKSLILMTACWLVWTFLGILFH